ncbi:hypothetical protein DENSPDRAFT_46315 [Dentipellis sp. KUC8613]|nr:hypothetical protein DENSPDRAFT_46315 [Dentipellis sp. KUC8613]
MSPPRNSRNMNSFGQADALSELPTTFRWQIGASTLREPLVQMDHLKCHLNLLRAFHLLREQVEAGTDERLPASARAMEKDQRWAWFVGLAVERFDRWAKKTRAVQDIVEWLTTEVPPIDVWMVWHAYLLNPRSYAEDCSRFLTAFARLPPKMFLNALTAIGDMTTFTPSDERRTLWFIQTKTPFDLFDAFGYLIRQEIICPNCHAINRASYINDTGTGYAQQHFAHPCSFCRFEITKEKLALIRFMTDLSLNHRDRATVLQHGNYVYLPMTLRSPFVSLDKNRAAAIKDLLLSTGPFKPKRSLRRGRIMKTPLAMAESVKWSLSRTRKIPVRARNPRILSRILTAYSDQRPFSVELTGAVLRQATFVEKMHELGWTEPNFFDIPEEEVVLSHATVRYHAFLDLMFSSPSSFFVPTLDIDLVWHTHQLLAANYQRDCIRYVGRYVDHDDKVEESHLADAFDLTCRAWNARFNVPYMHCGCPLPGETIGQKLARLVSNMGFSYKPKMPSLPDNPALLAATHPSEHNSVVVSNLPHQSSRRRKREKRTQRRRDRDAALVKQGKMHQDVFARGMGHRTAFLVPVPMYWGGVGSCVVGTGNIVNGGGCGGSGGFSGCGAVSLL